MKQKMNGFLAAGLTITALLLLLTVVGAFWTPYDPNAMSGSEKFLAPLPCPPLRHR